MVPFADPNLIVGLSTSDDAAVYRVASDQAVVITVDYFTPIHDDPFIFGQIAAANSLSDIYAMGARPILAVNVCGFPACSMPLEMMGEVLSGGRDRAALAGIAVAGGHTIDSPEPFYGMCVIGLVHPDRVITNCGAQPGDRLILTKPVGAGIVTSAMMFDAASEGHAQAAVASMISLNAVASEVMVRHGAHAATDVTGFGLVGHAHEMAAGSGVDLRIVAADVPALPGALEYAAEWIVTGVGQRNREHYGQWTDFGPASEEHIAVICDAQTSGGLLISLPEAGTDDALAEMRAGGVDAVLIGQVAEGNGTVRFV